MDKSIKWGEVIQKSYEVLTFARDQGWSWDETLLILAKATNLAGFESFASSEGE